MKILLPTPITQDMIGFGTNLPEIDATRGEISWTTFGVYTEGMLRVYAGYIYYCVKGYVTDINSPTPDADFIHWLVKEPTNQMGPFDDYLYTTAKNPGIVKYVLSPGYFDGFVLYGVNADKVEVVLRDRLTGVVNYNTNDTMWEEAYGEWEYLFGNLQRSVKLSQSNLPTGPATQIEVTLTKMDPTSIVELGYLSIGQWQTIYAPGDNMQGATQYGVEVTPKSYSYFKQNLDGTYVRRQGRVAKGISATALIDAVEAPRVEKLLTKILDIPVAIELSDLNKYGYMSTVGFVTGSIVAESWNLARVNLKIDGNI